VSGAVDRSNYCIDRRFFELSSMDAAIRRGIVAPVIGLAAGWPAAGEGADAFCADAGGNFGTTPGAHPGTAGWHPGSSGQSGGISVNWDSP